ncbi:hypothetical protein Y032_0244g3528 [Ancylostoma ceylanicum]|uniref:Uncharacterized protein n=1 Tax=Ancylostoma ceylanicum TaxID=53326 RepID=A0A016SE07_9BILA|nr:hypothetical protein Y032_0244g3528 [Ancylostoma ceylanicum]
MPRKCSCGKDILVEVREANRAKCICCGKRSRVIYKYHIEGYCVRAGPISGVIMLLRTLVLGFGLSVIQLAMICWVQKWYIVDMFATNTKFVRFHLNAGRLGNQLFHFITGYGIARTLGRRHYIPTLKEKDHVSNYLKQMIKVFPRLRETYVIAPVSFFSQWWTSI